MTASQGLMLESISERLMETVHAGSPTKHPARRLETIELAGELRIPFTSGILVGIGETEEERVASLEALAEVHATSRPPPGGDPPELRPASPLLRPRGRRDRRRGGQATLDQASGPGCQSTRPAGIPEPKAGMPVAPEWANPIGIEEMKRLIAECRRLMPEVGIQVPPNLADWWPQLVEAGATDLGGLSATATTSRPEEAFPSPHQVRKELAPRGYALTERLCAYPQYLDPEWMEQGGPRRGQAQVLELHPPARLGPAPGRATGARGGAAGDRAGQARRGS